MPRVVAVLALAVVLSGCSAAAPRSTPAPADPIPPIADAKKLAGTPPCDLITPVQLTANQIDLPGQATTVVDAPACKWNNNAHTREITVFVDVGHDALHNIYADRAKYQVFEITQIGGQPAIRDKFTVNGTSCYFVVAAARGQTFTLRFTSLGDGSEEPCGPARQLAETVLANLPPMQG